MAGKFDILDMVDKIDNSSHIFDKYHSYHKFDMVDSIDILGMHRTLGKYRISDKVRMIIGILGMVDKIIRKVIDMIDISHNIDNLFRILPDNLYHRHFGNSFRTLPDKLHRKSFDIPDILIHRHVGNLFHTLFDKSHMFDKYHKYRKFDKILDKAFDIIGNMAGIIGNIDMVDKGLDKMYHILDMVDMFDILDMVRRIGKQYHIEFDNYHRFDKYRKIGNYRILDILDMVGKIDNLIRKYLDNSYHKHIDKLFHILDMFHKYFDRIIRN